MFSPSSGSLNSVTEYLLLAVRCRREHPARALSWHCRTSWTLAPTYVLSICRIRFFRIDSKFLDCLLQHVELDLLLARQRSQRGKNDMLRIHLEEVAKSDSALAAPEAVCSQSDQRTRQPLR